jgi:hypothetical protein
MEDYPRDQAGVHDRAVRSGLDGYHPAEPGDECKSTDSADSFDIMMGRE